jgi:hypothetical protein
LDKLINKMTFFYVKKNFFLAFKGTVARVWTPMQSLLRLTFFPVQLFL